LSGPWSLTAFTPEEVDGGTLLTVFEFEFDPTPASRSANAIEVNAMDRPNAKLPRWPSFELTLQRTNHETPRAAKFDCHVNDKGANRRNTFPVREQEGH